MTDIEKSCDNCKYDIGDMTHGTKCAGCDDDLVNFEPAVARSTPPTPKRAAAMTDTNAIQRIKAHADSLESVPHNKQFRADLYALIEASAATPPADAAPSGNGAYAYAALGGGWDYTTPRKTADAALADATSETYIAIRNAKEVAASDAYFSARAFMLDTTDRRKCFEAGFNSGFDAAALSARSPQVSDEMAEEGLAYFERSGDDGDKKYVAAIRAALSARAVPDDAVRAELHGILEYVEGEMQSAYHNAYPECCGRGRDGDCCGSPEQAWSKEDQSVMDKLAPVQSRLRAVLAASKEAK